MVQTLLQTYAALGTKDGTKQVGTKPATNTVGTNVGTKDENK